jgi:citrate synthase
MGGPNIRIFFTELVRQFLAFLTGAPNPSIDHAASELATCWCRRAERAERLLNAVLILTLDHEINVSSFTARVVASAGSNLYEVVNAAMCAFSGSRHGRTSERAELVIRELEVAGSAGALIHARLRAGEEMPGFGHPLYPDGDPRARLILRLLAEDFPAEFAEIQRKINDSEDALHQAVNLDLAVAVVSKVLRLPVHSGFHLFALGRMDGWIAHAVEQHQSGEFIRPRARYTGVMPEAERDHRGELEMGSGLGDAVASVREVRASEKASHRGHRGHRGESEGGSGLGDTVAFSARSAGFGEMARDSYNWMSATVIIPDFAGGCRGR